jgi:pyrroline-5-carboxylate reductase
VKITFIGGGNMASALIGGLLADTGGGLAAPHEVAVIEPLQGQREALAQRWSVRTYAGPDEAAFDQAAVIVLAVKPQQMQAVARSIAPFMRDPLVISVAAGIRARDLSKWLGGYRRIVRSMPNTPALIGRGVTGVAMFDPSHGEDRVLAEQILQAVGEVVWVDDEKLLDAVTAVSGSGPAYVFRFMEAIEEAGRSLGLTADQARRLTLATFAGAAELALRSQDSPAVLRERVTSKGGTTAAALAVMQDRDLSALIGEALRAAAGRSEELGEEFGAAPRA